MKKLMAVSVLVLGLSGCAQQTFTIKDNAGIQPSQETRQTFFLSGIGQSKLINAAQVCGGADKVARTEVQESGLDVLFRVITFGIYTPREARVYCSI